MTGAQSLRVYPCGYPVDLESESHAVLRVVRELWGDWPQLFDRPPLAFAIEETGTGDAEEPRFEANGGTLLLGGVHGAAAFTAHTGCGWMRASVRDCERFAYFWLQPWVLTALDMVYFEPLHAACVSRDGKGILLCGDSGAGKTTLAYACGKAGWPLVSEDGVRLADGPAQTMVGGRWTYHLREAARELFPELSGVRVSQTLAGKRALLVEAHGAERTARPHRTVFLARGGETRVSEFPRKRAVEYFLETARNPAREESERRLRRMIESGCTLLEYSDLASAVEQLERML